MGKYKRFILPIGLLFYYRFIKTKSDPGKLREEVRFGYSCTLERLINEGKVNIDEQGGELKDTLLILAAQSYRSSSVKLLLDAGADHKIKDIFGRTALHYVGFYSHRCEEERFKMAKYLVAAGANIYETDNDGFTPCRHAVYGNKTQTFLRSKIIEEKIEKYLVGSKEIAGLIANFTYGDEWRIRVRNSQNGRSDNFARGV